VHPPQWIPYHSIFLYTMGDDGPQRREVPIPMVALVATVLYATIYEWHTGEQQCAEFSANVYLDVYLGHIGTLYQILEKRSGAFHTMMGEIYSQANTHEDGTSASVPTAGLNFEELEA